MMEAESLIEKKQGTHPANLSKVASQAPADQRQTVLENYQYKLQQQQLRLSSSLARWRRMAYVRGLMFLVSLVPLFLGFGNYLGLSSVWYVLAGLLFVCFLAIAFFHEGLFAELRRAKLIANMHRESLARCRRRWNEIQVPAIEVPKELSATSADLDLFTESSIYKLLGITRTPTGLETLRNWIINGASPQEIGERQAAVQELKKDDHWRLDFQIACEQLGPAKADGIVQWAESDDWLAGRRWLLYLTRITSLLALLSLAGLLIGVGPFWPLLSLLVGICLLHFVLSIFLAGTFHDIFNQISTRSDEALHYVTLFNQVANFPARSAKLTELQSRLKATNHSAQASMIRLGKLTGLANIRRSGLLFIPYLALEFLVFWDVHCLDWLERWKRIHGSQVRGWFEDLGQWEALCALAKLAADEPEWTFPEIIETQQPRDAVIEAKQLGHPLLDEHRVCNDVTVGPPGTLLLVTGSNMSGKSTLLRSIGANVVLAQMGSVVCARSMRLPCLKIETSMRIADSLADGVSFFMAELKRLKSVVDSAGQIRQEPGRTMLFLLDEILQGTNSQERQIAVSRVVRKLIDEEAIGAISTHDLDLATTSELKDACQTVHFSEQFVEVDGKQQMTFDYRMKQGISKTTNALKLLELVGLE